MYTHYMNMVLIDFVTVIPDKEINEEIPSEVDNKERQKMESEESSLHTRMEVDEDDELSSDDKKTEDFPSKVSSNVYYFY